MFPLFFVLTVALFLNPLRTRIQTFVDRTFYRLEYDYRETVKPISVSIRSLIGLDDMQQTMMRFALEPMLIDSGCILLRHKDRPTYQGTIKARKPEPQGEDATGPVGSPTEIPLAATIRKIGLKHPVRILKAAIRRMTIRRWSRSMNRSAHFP